MLLGRQIFWKRDHPNLWPNFIHVGHRRTCGKVWWRSSERSPRFGRKNASTCVALQPRIARSTTRVRPAAKHRPVRSAIAAGRPKKETAITSHQQLEHRIVQLLNLVNKASKRHKKAVLSQRWPRDAPYIWMSWKIFGSPSLHPQLLFPNFFNGLLFPLSL